MAYGSKLAQTNFVDERRRILQSLEEKRGFRRHLSVYCVLNLAFWLSWLIGGLREEWLAPWPLVPTIGWGTYLLFRSRRLGGRKALSRAAIDHAVVRLGQLDRPARQDWITSRPIAFADSVSYRPIRPFHLREIIDARGNETVETIERHDRLSERIIDLRNRRDQGALVENAVTPVEQPEV